MQRLEMLSAGTPAFTEAGKKAWCAMCARLKETCEEHWNAYQNVDCTGPISRADVHREFRLARRRYESAEAVLNASAVIEPATDASAVRIGTVVTIRIEGKEPQTFEVGDYGSDDPKMSPPVVSYSSRLVRPLLEHAVGDDASIVLANGTLKDVEILDIRMPHAPAAIQLAA